MVLVGRLLARLALAIMTLLFSLEVDGWLSSGLCLILLGGSGAARGGSFGGGLLVVFAAVLHVVFDHALLQVFQVQRFQKLLKSFSFLFKLDEEFLGVAACLGTGARAHMLLHTLPLLAVVLECFEEAEMFVLGPATSLLDVFQGGRRAHGRADLLGRFGGG